MGDKTHIGWTDATWSPVTGCTKISEGCSRCYIETTPPFRIEGRKFLPLAPAGELGIGATTGVRLHPDRLDVPVRWTKPRRVFVCSLADLFHDEVPDEFIARVWASMVLAPQHQFQVLTKRPARMRTLLSSSTFQDQVDQAVLGLASVARREVRDSITSRNRSWLPLFEWPLPNVWVGVSVENQKWADLRIPILLDTPAAVRFLSCEPLLGPVDLTRWVERADLPGDDPANPDGDSDECILCDSGGLDWVIAGGESGRDARPMELAWAETLQAQCADAGVAFFFKQTGKVLAQELGLPGKGENTGQWPMQYPPGQQTGANGKAAS